MLTGMMLLALDQELEVGFFLHIPFQPPKQFFVQYRQVAMAVLRGLLSFTKALFYLVSVLVLTTENTLNAFFIR